MKNKFTLVLSLLIFSQFGNAQQQYQLCVSDSVKIGLPFDVIGADIQWRSSSDTINFTDLTGEDGDTLLVSVSDTTYFYAMIQGDNCDPFSSDTIVVFPIPLPSTADAGDDITDTTYQISLNATAPTIGEGEWSFFVTDGNGSFSDINNPNATFTGTPSESYVLIWTVTNAPCASISDTINVNLGASPPTLDAITCLGIAINVAPADANGGDPMPWGCTGSGPIAQSSSETDGLFNTQMIMANCPDSNNTAGGACANLDTLGYDDWYLPATDELQCLRDELAEPNPRIGGFVNGGQYHTSTENAGGISPGSVRFRTFPTGTTNNIANKTANRYVRCIRRP